MVVRSVILIITFFSSLITPAQDKAPVLPRFAVRGNVAVPNITSSKLFRQSFSGVINADANVSCRLWSNFFIGIGYSYTYFKCQSYFSNPKLDNINTHLQLQNGYVKLGYDQFFSNNGFVSFSLNTGYGNSTYRSVRYKHDSLAGKYPTQFGSSFIEPVVGLYFIVDPNFAFGGHVSYNYNFARFNSLYPQLNEWGPPGYNTLPNKWNMSMVTVGFGFYYGLAKK